MEGYESAVALNVQRSWGGGIERDRESESECVALEHMRVVYLLQASASPPRAARAGPSLSRRVNICISSKRFAHCRAAPSRAADVGILNVEKSQRSANATKYIRVHCQVKKTAGASPTLQRQRPTLPAVNRERTIIEGYQQADDAYLTLRAPRHVSSSWLVTTHIVKLFW
ncbi:hypothetical protein EVAR_69537_1 [Eumeta japonica]|uniref:Uncharacterized protein n=1 Tax=Eumeta variegata TaxID=151549 RepID=A0A4C2A6S8_EUMVA|nr:hypothetical protein EVAR_69537_1 [Eumeta japonica]